MVDLDKILCYQKNLINHCTKFELYFFDKLKNWNIKFEFQYPLSDEHSLYFLDFYFPDHNTYIELDGKHHRADNEQIKKDRKRHKIITTKWNIKEIRLKNKRVYKITKKELLMLFKGEKHKRKKKSIFKKGMTLAQKVQAKKRHTKFKKKSLCF